MPQTEDIAILAPLAVGFLGTLCTIAIHSVAVTAVVRFVRHQQRTGRAGSGFWIDGAIVVAVILMVLSAHLLAITAWALFFVACGALSTLKVALVHSAMIYTTLGGEIASNDWRLIAPLEATVSLLMFGVSTAIIFTVMHRLVEQRFQELRT